MTSTKITETEISKLKVASLPSRPTAPKSFGGSGFTASEMKAAFDRLPLYIISRFNELIEDLTREGDEGVLGAIPSGIREEHTLADMLSDVVSGAFASYLQVLGSSLTETVSELREKIRLLTLGAEDNSSNLSDYLARLDALEASMLAEIEAASVRLSNSLETHKSEAASENSRTQSILFEHDSRLMDLEMAAAAERLDYVESSINELSETLSSTEGSIGELNEKLNPLVEGDVEGRLTAVEDNVISLDMRVTALEDGGGGDSGSEAIAALAAEIKNPTEMTIDCGGPDDLA